jgi:hypothetical protein
MLRETHDSYATLLEGFLKEMLMDNDFNANSGHINLSEYVDKTRGISGVDIREQLRGVEGGVHQRNVTDSAISTTVDARTCCKEETDGRR